MWHHLLLGGGWECGNRAEGPVWPRRSKNVLQRDTPGPTTHVGSFMLSGFTVGAAGQIWAHGWYLLVLLIHTVGMEFAPPQEGNLPEFKEKVHFITLLFPQSCFLSSPGDLRIGFTSHECLFEMELELELQNRGVPG